MDDKCIINPEQDCIGKNYAIKLEARIESLESWQRDSKKFHSDFYDWQRTQIARDAKWHVKLKTGYSRKIERRSTMNKFLAQYAWEIMDLGKENHVDNATARAMFCENLSTFGTEAFPNYPGANVDYEALSAQWQAMSAQEQGEAKIACGNLMRDCYDALSEARRNNDMAAYYRVILNYEAPEVEKPDYLLYTHAWDIWDKADAEGIDLESAKAAYIETLPEWAGLTDEQKEAENYWFAAKVAAYDKGLEFARLTDDRALFEAILSTR